MTAQLPKVLIIDDTPSNLQTLGRALAREFDLYIAASGPEGLRLTESIRPDAILLDIMMPGMDGYETFNCLRALPGGSNLSIIFLTADDRDETQIKCLELGADDYASKPFVLPVLLTRIRHVIARRAARESQRLAASVFKHAREGIIITDQKGAILDVNNAFSYISGYSPDEALGHNPRMFSSGRQDKSFYVSMWAALTTKGHWYGEIWNRNKDGNVYAAMLAISAVRNDIGETSHYIGMFADITALKQQQAQLEHIAHYDVLTGLANRLLLGDRLRQAMKQATRREQQLAVAYLDLDGFKSINDKHGHAVGDQLLIALADQMKQALREGDTLARIGGDEFVAVLVDLDQPESSLPIINRLLAAASQPVAIGSSALNVSASLGVTFYPQTEDVEADQLVRQADQAMYLAKQSGKDRYHVFDAEHDRDVRGRLESLTHIRLALANGEFVLHYQPKIDMRTGKVLGAEALIRWQHPLRGLLSPALFLPVIEGHPFAIELGEWVIETALHQIEMWHAEGLNVPVSVNIGAMQLQHPDFISRLRTMLDRHPGVLRGDLELEVLETSALDNFQGASEVIIACQQMGVGFALDDFGTGYSSLAYLKKLPPTVLKIDQGFVRDMLDDPEDLALLEGILGLSSAFRRQVIAEGVETEALGKMLVRMGCVWGQGYAIAHPMPAANLPNWMATWVTPGEWQTCKPISRDQFPALGAIVEHRAWLTTLVSCLNGNPDAAALLNDQPCHFSDWMDQGGRALLFGGQTDHPVDQLHQQVHRLGAELLDLKRAGRHDEALARLPALQRLNDQLLDQLNALF